MFHHKRHTLWQRLIMAIRDVRSLAVCSITCQGCGSSKVTGDKKSWICHDCGSMWQSG